MIISPHFQLIVPTTVWLHLLPNLKPNRQAGVMKRTMINMVTTQYFKRMGSVIEWIIVYKTKAYKDNKENTGMTMGIGHQTISL